MPNILIILQTYDKYILCMFTYFSVFLSSFKCFYEKQHKKTMEWICDNTNKLMKTAITFPEIFRCLDMRKLKQDRVASYFSPTGPKVVQRLNEIILTT